MIVAERKPGRPICRSNKVGGISEASALSRSCLAGISTAGADRRTVAQPTVPPATRGQTRSSDQFSICCSETTLTTTSSFPFG